MAYGLLTKGAMGRPANCVEASGVGAAAEEAPRGAPETQDLLRSAVQALHAHGGRASEREGDRIWAELLAGGWSVVERAHRDGRRYLLLERAAGRPERRARGEARAILKLLEAGRSSKQIAIELGLTDSAVSLHVREALNALGFRNVVEYLRFARRRGPR